MPPTQKPHGDWALLLLPCSTLSPRHQRCGSKQARSVVVQEKNLHFFKSSPLWCPHGHGWKGCSKAFRRMRVFLGKTVTSEPSDHSTSNVFGDRSKSSWQGTAITEPPLLLVLSSPPASNTQTFFIISLLFSKAGSASGSSWIQHCYRHWWLRWHKTWRKTELLKHFPLSRFTVKVHLGTNPHSSLRIIQAWSSRLPHFFN